MITTGGSSSAVNQVSALRRYVPWSIAAGVIAALAALLAFRGSSAAAPILPLAFAVATQPMFVAGSVLGGLFAGVILFLGGALAVVAFAPWRRWMIGLLAVGAALALAWVGSILAQPAWFDAIDTARLPTAIGFGLVGLAAVADPRRLIGSIREGGGPGFVDVAYAAITIALLATAAAVGRVEVEYLAVGAVVAAAVYAIWRRNAISAFDRFVTSRARRDAAILAVEEERGRLARDIHDAPLQDLSGVIRRLDAVSGAEAEATALREVAARLRDVATALRPPVLQDLGLVAAIEDLRDQLLAGNQGWEVVVDIDDVGGGRRPPSEVEIAGLRVMQEAAANAVAHSDGRRLDIRGTVASTAIDLAAADDGRGFGDDRARVARRAGHFGLDSMRERAEAVGAETLVTSGPEGVTVRFRWEGPA
jgi:signal transduction histidine kinase